MPQLSVFLFFWVTMTLSLHLGDVLAFIVLMPLFLILHSLAESVA